MPEAVARSGSGYASARSVRHHLQKQAGMNGPPGVGPGGYWRYRHGDFDDIDHHADAAVRVVQPGRGARVGRVPCGYSGLTREAYELDLRQYVRGAQNIASRCSVRAVADIECFGRHLEASDEPGRRSRGGCAQSLLLSLRRRRRPHRRLARGARSASATRLRVPRTGLTATKSAPCSSRPASPARAITRSSACSRSMGCGSRSDRRRHRRARPRTRPPHADGSCAKAARS